MGKVDEDGEEKAKGYRYSSRIARNEGEEHEEGMVEYYAVVDEDRNE